MHILIPHLEKEVECTAVCTEQERHIYVHNGPPIEAAVAAWELGWRLVIDPEQYGDLEPRLRCPACTQLVRDFLATAEVYPTIIDECVIPEQ